MANTYLTRTQSTPTSTRIATFSFWCKRSSTGSYEYIISTKNSGSTRDGIAFSADDDLDIRFNAGSSSPIRVQTSRKFRDPSGFYHILVALDTTQATASNRVKIYVNGVQETSMVTSNYPSQNYDFSLNATSSYATIIGKNGLADDSYFNGLLTHFHAVDGTAYAASTFGSTDSTTGEWKINTSPSFTLGNNGFTILKDGNTITDQSSNSNDFSLGGGTLTKTEDCPSNVFATINTLQGTIASGYTIENGNLSTNGTSSNTWRSLPATLASSSGKFYWEIKVASFSYAIHFGIQDVDQAVQTDNYAYQYSRAYMYLNDGTKNNGGSGSSYGNSWTTNDIIGVALDMDNLKLYFSKNGVWQNSGDPTSGSTGTGSAFTLASGYAYTPMFSSHSSSDKYQINFGNGYFGTTAVSSAGTNASGNGIFEYDTPTGYTALSTKGLNL